MEFTIGFRKPKQVVRTHTHQKRPMNLPVNGVINAGQRNDGCYDGVRPPKFLDVPSSMATSERPNFAIKYTNNNHFALKLFDTKTNF